LDSKILLGIIAVTILGTFAVSGMMVQAGLEDLEIITVVDPVIHNTPTPGSVTSTATCPNTHKVIGGGIEFWFHPGPSANSVIRESIDVATNSYSVEAGTSGSQAQIQAFATCAKINFPLSMSMIGGELLDINTVSLLVGAIGTNPVITGLVAITLAGVAGQAVWFVHRRKKSENS